MLKVKHGGEEIKNPEVKAIAQKEAVSYALNVTNVKDKTNVKAEIENYFNVADKTYFLMVEFYDAKGSLLNVVTTNKQNVAFDETYSPYIENMVKYIREK